MKSLIVDFDLFGKEGGGQTVYRNLILRNPSIEFTYLGTQSAPAGLPAHVQVVPFEPKFTPEYVALGPADELYYSAYLTARNVAYSVRGLSFDVADIPDYYNYAGFLAPAFREFGVQVGKVVQSLHGRLSETMFLNWEAHSLTGAGKAEDLRTLRVRKRAFKAIEESSLRAADIRYGISTSYIRSLQAGDDPLAFQYLHPFKIIELPEMPASLDGEAARPTVLYIGRLERAKGPDLFLDLVWLSGAGDLARLKMIGADEIFQERSVRRLLADRARRRGVRVDFVNQVDRREILEMLAGPGLLLCTSRFESFGLVPLEAILRGSLSGFSAHCGIHEFVRETWPDLKFLSLDSTRMGETTAQLREMLESYGRIRRHNYAHCRERLNSLLPDLGPSRGFMEEIYSAASDARAQSRDELDYLYLCQNVSRRFVCPSSRSSLLRSMLRAALPQPLWDAVKNARSLAGRARRGVRTLPRRTAKFLVRTITRSRVPALEVLLRELHSSRQTRLLGRRVESYDVIHNLASVLRIGRASVFRALGLAERQRGNIALSHVYNVRCCRWSGQAAFGELEAAATVLRERGFTAVADVLPWLDATREDENATAVQDYLSSRAGQLGCLPQPEYELHDVRHQRSTHKVSIIVSLYEAHDKVPHFTGLLRELDLVRSRQAEVIFVDSGSPHLQITPAQFQELAERMDVTLLRTARRETIPGAWNRGLAEARGEYLVFLGADEMVTGHALGKLAAYLDAHPHVDWVVGNGVIMNVDRQGAFLDEGMSFDRTHMGSFSPILDAVHLTYVGGMYRRSLHDRAGYYDSSFRGASDTEFKYRIFPLARFARVPDTLGIFMNYPEQRMTEHPRAEVEDLLAMHLYKTPGGLRYLLKGRSEQDLVELLRQAVSFRRCYAETVDTDMDLAVHASRMLRERNPDSPLYARWVEEFTHVRDLLRAIDTCDGSLRSCLGLRRQAGRLRGLQARHSRDLDVPVYYYLLNDIRFTVHANVWNLKEKTF